MDAVEIANGSVQVIKLEVAVVLTVLGFVVGFFVNLLAMKKMFISQDYCLILRQSCTNANCLTDNNVDERLKNLEASVISIQKCQLDMHGKISTIVGILEAKNGSSSTKLRSF